MTCNPPASRQQKAGPISAASVDVASRDQAATVTVPTEACRKALFSVAKEQVQEVEASVSGTLPSWLNGSLIVNGGGDYSAGLHMFDGYALVAKIRMQGGKAWGSQRYVDTEAYRGYKSSGKPIYREFAAPIPTDGFLEATRQVLSDLKALLSNNPSYTDNASVNLHQVGEGGRLLLATSETPGASYWLDPNTLDTLKKAEFPDDLKGDLTTAHPSIMSDGSMLNFTRTIPNGGFNMFKQDPVTLKRTKVAYIPDRNPMSPVWVHDFPATEQHAVIVEYPLYMNLSSLMFNTKSDYLFMNWKPEDGTLVHLVTLDGSKPVKTFKVPNFFTFHYANAFYSEDGTTLHVDMGAYDDPAILNDLLLSPLVSPGPQQQVARSSLRRMSIPLEGEEGTMLEAPEVLTRQDGPHQEFCEFPRVNPTYKGKPHRFVYSLSAVRPTNMGNAASKVDTHTGTASTWHLPGGTVGEPCFIPSPSAAAEDDGVVLVPGMGPDGKSFLVVLDPGRWEEVARVELPFATPYRFHGIWLGA